MTNSFRQNDQLSSPKWPTRFAKMTNSFRHLWYLNFSGPTCTLKILNNRYGFEFFGLECPEELFVIFRIQIFNFLRFRSLICGDVRKYFMFFVFEIWNYAKETLDFFVLSDFYELPRFPVIPGISRNFLEFPRIPWHFPEFVVYLPFGTTDKHKQQFYATCWSAYYTIDLKLKSIVYLIKTTALCPDIHKIAPIACG